MDDTEFDGALISFAMRLAAERGWAAVTVAQAARAAGLPLERARARFPTKAALLLRFGRRADQAALTGADTEGAVRDRLFDIIMRRIDALQAHRDGVLALFRALPADPATAAMLGAASLRSMGWMLEGAGIDSSGLMGLLRAKGLLVVWLATVRAWTRDEGEDLSATMAALDSALRRAEQVQGWIVRGGTAAGTGDETPAPAAEDGDVPLFEPDATPSD